MSLPESEWFGNLTFDDILNLEGEVYRAVKNRRTLRVLPEVEKAALGTNGEDNGEDTVAPRGPSSEGAFFLKIHLGVGWREIVKNWLNFKRPILGARNEYLACEHLARQGIAAPEAVAFAERGWNPARRKSFVVCREIQYAESLENVCGCWHESPPDVTTRTSLIYAVAELIRRMHDSGLVHRDLYICHILFNPQSQGGSPLTLLDLHRALIFDTLPRRWRERDLAALLFSTLDLGLSRRDWLRFIRHYRGGRALRDILSQEGDFWEAVYRRALKLYAKGVKRGLAEGHFYSTPQRASDRFESSQRPAG